MSLEETIKYLTRKERPHYVDIVRGYLKQFDNQEISFSKFVELLNVDAFKFCDSKAIAWTPIDPANLPKGEVLAACFETAHDFFNMKLYGEVAEMRVGSKSVMRCRSDYGQLLFPVTHYIDINKIKMP